MNAVRSRRRWLCLWSARSGKPGESQALVVTSSLQLGAFCFNYINLQLPIDGIPRRQGHCNMGIFGKALGAAGWSSLAGAAFYVTLTRHCVIKDVPPTDYIFSNTLYARYNPNNAPVTQDICVRQVPLNKIKPELLEQDGKLVEAFCQGIWGGLGTRPCRSL
jgi:hypothetical protein